MKSLDTENMRRHAESIFLAGVRAVEPQTAIEKHCRIDDNMMHVGGRAYDLDRYSHIYVIGCGKAAASMAAVMENMLDDRITAGIVIVKYQHTADLNRVQVVEAGHPIPDDNGCKGAESIVNLSRSADKQDLVICLISGGGSALLPLPAANLTLADKQETIKALLQCGATIHEINAIRKHTSAIKGGLLAREVFPAELLTLILSDVVGDDLDAIASGPCVPDASTYRDCLNIVAKYGIETVLPSRLRKHLQQGADGLIPETPDPGDKIFERTFPLIVGSNSEALEAAYISAVQMGYNSLILSSMIEGDTGQVAGTHGAIAREIVNTGHPTPMPACILSGGETTVVLKGDGLGGRNQQFALAAAIDIAGHEPIVVLSGGTDGTDGPTDAAGAFADGSTRHRAIQLGMDPLKYLADNDAYHFFERLDDLLITGPTGTNVMDLRVMLIGDAAK
jgi:hydroxypyruvate reductase